MNFEHSKKVSDLVTRLEDFMDKKCLSNRERIRRLFQNNR